MARTVEQATNDVGFPKPGELIEFTGTHDLEAMDRALLNLLYQHAHDNGLCSTTQTEWTIPVAQIRPSSHESNDRLRESLERLMRVVVTIHYAPAGKDDPGFLLVHLFDFFELPATMTKANAALAFGIPAKLRPILARSGRWGRIKAEVACAMTSRYAIAVYELTQLRAQQRRNVEVFPIERFRALLGVPPEAYRSNSHDFMRNVLDIAETEVNGLSDMNVKLELRRRGVRGPVLAAAMTWWRKTSVQQQAAREAIAAPKKGRTARLRGKGS